MSEQFDPSIVGISSVYGALDFFMKNGESVYGKEISVMCNNVSYTGELYFLNNQLIVLRKQARGKILDGPHKDKSPTGYTFLDPRFVSSVTFEIPELK